jgi:O-antigen ligase
MEKLLLDTNSSETSPVVLILDKVIQFCLFTFVAFSMFSISITQISFALGALAWIFKTHLTKSWKELKGTRVGVAILCFCLSCVLSIAASVDFENSLGLLKKLIQFVIFFWVANAVRDEKQRDLLVALLITAGVIVALNGIYSHLQSNLGYRIQGTMSTPATFSGTLMLAGLVTLGRFLFRKPKENWVLVSAGIIGFCLLVSLTRQAWIGSFMGTLFLLFFWSKKYLLLIPLLLTGIFFYGPPSVKYRISTSTSIKDSMPLQERISTWKGGWKIFKDHPITGCGFKCVDSIHSQYPDPSGLIAHFRGMHSNLFQLLVDTGIVGLGTWLSIWVMYSIEIFIRWRNSTEEKLRINANGILMGASAATIGFLIGGLFEASIYDSEVSMLLYFLMGLSMAKVKKAPETS